MEASKKIAEENEYDDFKPVTLRKDIKDQVEKQLNPVFLEFFPSSNQYLLYKQYFKRFQEKNSSIENFLSSYRAFTLTFCQGLYSSKITLVERENQATFLRATTYLTITELIGNDFVDRTLLLLIGKGHDFHLEPDNNHHYTRHAKNLEDLEESYIPLAVKLDFLKTNNLPFFSKWIDHNLRNKIAHLDYKIKEGCFYVKYYKKEEKINLREKIKEFTEYYQCLTELFSKQEKIIQNHEPKGSSIAPDSPL